jgi:hypothetical protein
MKKISFKSPPNRTSKIEPRLDKIHADEKDPDFLTSENPDSESVTPVNMKSNQKQASF